VITQVRFRTSHDMGFKGKFLNGLLIFPTGFQCHAMTFHYTGYEIERIVTGAG
jgi:hypothetical protein